MAKQTTYPETLKPPEYYIQMHKDEQGNKSYALYERLIAGEGGICIFESRRRIDAEGYRKQLVR